MNKIPVGISACVLGQNVRFDTGHKRSQFVCQELTDLMTFTPVCPEMGAGMPAPRPTIRLIRDEERMRLMGSRDKTLEVTEQVTQFSKEKIAQLHHLCGYILCAKSPTCGMERVPVYSLNSEGGDKSGTGLYAAELMKQMPWLPVEEDGRLNDPILRENFIARVFALHHFYECMEGGLTVEKFISFHSKYKLMLMATAPDQYKSLGRDIAALNDADLESFFLYYRQSFMDLMKQRSNKKTHANTLFHIQGYFKKFLSKQEKQELSQLIHDYRQGFVPLLAPLTLLSHYLQKYPNDYLSKQVYLRPHPLELKLRYGL
ncbi:YbgA family protein [Algicola sagamiensis]|uniref:YbgA family protein n=1 Tax=Algicola sagamiensis TaxID=163869 RepID=UPI00037E7DCF|nr:DUF523 and DUF1722 domain-containing protein [Algicola sagamiensis]